MSYDWQADAACRGVDPEIFFPGPDDDEALPKTICAACPVQQRCLGFAVAVGERFGVWGGLTDKERKQLSADERRRILQRAAARAA